MALQRRAYQAYRKEAERVSMTEPNSYMQYAAKVQWMQETTRWNGVRSGWRKMDNGLGISDVADFTHHRRYEEPKLNKEQMFNRSTSAAILLIPC